MWMMKRRIEKIRRKTMIVYDYIFDDEELEPYRKMYDNWNGFKTQRSMGDREILLLKEYPNSEKLLSSYNKILPDLVKGQFDTSLKQGYTIDAKLSLYDVGQQYEWHHDADPKVKHEKNPAWSRIVSSITYLNDDYEGGETEFMDRTIVPESGKTVIFHHSLHVHTEVVLLQKVLENLSDACLGVRCVIITKVMFIQ